MLLQKLVTIRPTIYYYKLISTMAVVWTDSITLEKSRSDRPNKNIKLHRRGGWVYVAQVGQICL